jgi:hypothetical protein
MRERPARPASKARETACISARLAAPEKGVSRMLEEARRGEAIALACLLTVQACAAPRAPRQQTAEGACIVAEGATGWDTLTLVLDGAVDPTRAPIPSRFSERIAFAHFYETLVRVDCVGEVTSGLAVEWRKEDDGRRWRFTLRPDAAFPDGTPVTATAVLASWSRGARRRPRPWGATLDESVTVFGDRTLAVTLDRPYATVPLIFAHPGLAVSGPTTDASPWPFGSASLAPIGGDAGGVTARAAGTMGRDAFGTLLMRWAGPDPRDAIDAGFDLLVTRTPAISAYASASGMTRVVPLPWDRVYVLLAPAPKEQARARATLRLEEDFTAAAAGSDARGSAGPYWWESVDCPLPATGKEAGPDPARRIVYRSGDATARGLAERLVALAATGRLPPVLGQARSGIRFVGVGLDGEPFAEALRIGADAGYVVATERTVLDPCTAAREGLAAAPWPGTLVPLVDTRAHLVVREGRGRVRVAWDGTPVLAAAEPAP